MSQSVRKNPAQHNTLITLTSLLKEVPASDCIIILGDLNVQLPADIPNITGKWATHKGIISKHAETFVQLMRMFEFKAANTFFQQKKGCSNATFIQSIGANAPARSGADADVVSIEF